MIARRSCAGFLFKTVKSISVGGVFLTLDLDRYLASKLHVFGKVDLAHTTRTKLFDDSIMGDFVH